MYVVNFIKSDDIEVAKKKWEMVADGFVEKPGITSVNLYEVTAKENNNKDKISYQLVSIVECESIKKYKEVKQELFAKLMLKGLDKDEGSAFVMGEDTFCTTLYLYGDVKLDTDKLLLINPIKISNAQIEKWFGIWKNISEEVIKKPGFEGVNYLETIPDNIADSEIKHINIAVWKNKEYIANVREDKDYAKNYEALLKEYPMEPSYCRNVSTKTSQLQSGV